MGKIFLLSLVVCIFSSQPFARAATKSPFYVEPYAGYFIGKLEADNFIDGDIKSYTVGARIGVETQRGLIVGIDYSTGKGNFEPKDSAIDKMDYEQRDLGAFIGYRLHPKVRVYGIRQVR